jgi:hypothetical protein
MCIEKQIICMKKNTKFQTVFHVSDNTYLYSYSFSIPTRNFFLDRLFWGSKIKVCYHWENGKYYNSNVPYSIIMSEIL